MRDGVKVAGAVVAIVLLACNAAVIADWRFGHLEEARFTGAQHAARQEDKQGQTAKPEQANAHTVTAPLTPDMIGSEAERQQGQGATEPRRASKEQDGPHVFLWRWLAWVINAVISGTHFTDWAIAFAGIASAIAAAFQYSVYRQQAGIMTGQLTTAAKTMTIGQRAYVTLEAVQRQFRTSNGMVKGLRVAPRWRNSGITPALKVRYYTSFDIVTDYEDANYAPPVIDSESGYSVIGPGLSKDGPEIGVRRPRVQRPINELLIVYGTVDYTDIFGDAHRTEFGVVCIIDWNTQTVAPMSRTAAHNGVDEDCVYQPYAKPGSPPRARHGS